jgi:hypothetical protein
MSDMDTQAGSGAACHVCGDDAVWAPTIAEGSQLVDRPLCGACSDDLTTVCPGCYTRIWQKDGERVFVSSELECKGCYQSHFLIAEGRESASRADVRRDDETWERR